MNVTILAVDKLREAYVREGCDMYAQRIAPYVGIETVEVRKASGDDALAAWGHNRNSWTSPAKSPAAGTHAQPDIFAGRAEE